MTMQDPSIHLKVNGEAVRATAPTVAALLAERGVAPESASGIAVARNGAVVPRARWAETALADGDSLEIIGAVQGG